MILVTRSTFLSRVWEILFIF